MLLLFLALCILVFALIYRTHSDDWKKGQEDDYEN